MRGAARLTAPAAGGAAARSWRIAGLKNIG